jgi:hypothetical protein
LNKIKNILRVLVTGSFTMLLSACYGVTVPFSKRFIAKNSDGEAIKGLEISYKTFEDSVEWFLSGETDIDGEHYLTTYGFGGETYSFKVEDTDGAENLGEFTTKYFNELDDTEDITMQEE